MKNRKNASKLSKAAVYFWTEQMGQVTYEILSQMEYIS